MDGDQDCPLKLVYFPLQDRDYIVVVLRGDSFTNYGHIRCIMLDSINLIRFHGY